ncbi:MAG: dockerin type I repeat-containing protein [Clostridia bacterium]|nr:dockerin type I repeat-containing protein [Clostridia bacterium]
MRNVKKLLSLLLAMLVLCQGTLLVFAEETAETAEWTYDNSMLVKINTEEAKIFTPEDFPDTNCTEVLTTEKLPTETGYSYELMLIFDTSNDFDWQSTADALLATQTICNASRNVYAEDYNMKHCTFTLTAEELHVPVGGKAWLQIKDEKYTGYSHNMWNKKAIAFTVDPDIIDEDAFTWGYFKSFGVDSFFPDIEGIGDSLWEVEHLIYSCPSEYRDTKSEIHRYYGMVEYSYNGYEDTLKAANTLSHVEGITSVKVYAFSAPTGTITSEHWQVDSESVSLLLSGGIDHDYPGGPYNQTAEITGINVGSAVVSVSKRLVASCNVTVYLADANNDGECDSLDAALVLKYDAEMAEATEELLLCDMNSDGIVNSLDAAFILRYDAELE